MEAEEKAAYLGQTGNKHRKLLFYFLLLTLNFHSLNSLLPYSSGTFEGLGCSIIQSAGGAVNLKRHPIRRERPSTQHSGLWVGCFYPAALTDSIKKLFLFFLCCLWLIKTLNTKSNAALRKIIHFSGKMHSVFMNLFKYVVNCSFKDIFLESIRMVNSGQNYSYTLGSA